MANPTETNTKLDELIGARLTQEIKNKDIAEWGVYSTDPEFVEVHFSGAFTMPTDEFEHIRQDCMAAVLKEEEEQ